MPEIRESEEFNLRKQSPFFNTSKSAKKEAKRKTVEEESETEDRLRYQNKTKKYRKASLHSGASAIFKREEELTSISSKNENSLQDGRMFKKGRKPKKGQRKPVVLCVSKDKRKIGMTPIGRRTRSQAMRH